MTHSEALHDGGVWPEIAVLGIGDVQLAILGAKRSKHHPGHEGHVSRNQHPVSYA